ncbi:FAD-dependent oxidoreductase [Methylopila jiangsuensis]|uniref:FAD-dependent oxidoreductase n=1 Tax=Methylopila jiangsuensis TaxID=586230 RepID=A0A9W6JC78_9HYPH|nr:FAD-dependent oxidoreductase [Methylopila jiangsuensis]MDR6287315.1 4-methylaminobutanoate oxidase (formaldehyde-forming) [Methylopila jiangsuensis]GLK74895.1 FAD-dependent oxidoreductase [Methylopila jiangsuensis]
MADFPTQAQIVIVGGGIIGCSTAYHLARLGFKDTVLLEKHKLTSGSTFHAAGLVGQLRSNANITQLLGESVKLYRTLEEETGLATGWKMNGGLRLACTEERWTEVKRQATTARSFGLEMHLLSPKEAQELWPLMDVSDVIGAAFLPTDGQANPSDITGSLAKGARMNGARILEDTTVTGFRIENGRVVAVETDRGPIACEIVVNCAGQWAREVGAMAGVNVPLVSVEHQYMVTERIEGVTSTLPTLRDPDRLTYYKEEVGGLVMGGYEPNPIGWARDGIPAGFNFQLLPSNFDHFEPLMELALGRVPALQTAGVKELINGPESFTPDGNFILGQAPELTGFYVGAGFNAFGIASGGGAGKALAEWIAGGRPPYDLSPVDILRFGKNASDVEWVRARTLEAYGKHYTIAWPHEEHDSGRPLRRSPLYDRLAAKRAVFGEKLGWERPNWFAGEDEEPRDRYTFGRPNWTGAVAREHAAAREAVALFDQSSFAKFLLTGRDAEDAISWLSAADMRRPVGSVLYAPMLNPRGGVECDLTVARLSPTDYYLIAGTGAATRDFDWIRRNLPKGLDASLVDVTSAYAVLALMGPNARRLLERVTRDDVSDAAFPFAAWRRLNLAGAPVTALRMTFVGELGYELHVPVEFGAALYDALTAAGADLGLTDAGYRAIETLRLEKGYWATGAEVGPDHSPFEAGIGWALKLDGPEPFLGREAAEAQAAAPLKKRLAGFTVDDPDVVLLGRETIYRNGERVGWLSSGGFGHTLGKPIGYGYVRREGVDEAFVLSGDYELDVATVRVPARVHLGALYDPEMARILA